MADGPIAKGAYDLAGNVISGLKTPALITPE